MNAGQGQACVGGLLSLEPMVTKREFDIVVANYEGLRRTHDELKAAGAAPYTTRLEEQAAEILRLRGTIRDLEKRVAREAGLVDALVTALGGRC